MKTLTEFTGSVIRMAAKAVAEAQRTLPKDAPAPAPAPEAAPAEPKAEEAKPVEAAPAEEAKPADAAPVEAKAEEAKPVEAKPAAPDESEAVKAALDEAVGKATGLTGDRLSRLREALKAVGKRTEDVRLVRVFGPEEPVPGAKTVGGFQFIVEFMPANMKQIMKAPDRDRNRGGKPGGASGKNAAAATTGGFSMDAVKADRQNEKRGPGGRPGGGGGRPGGRPGGGGGGRPGGGPGGRPPGGGGGRRGA